MENAPAWLQPITKVLPLPYLANALRDAITFGADFGDIWQDLVILLVFFVAAMVIAVRFFRWDTKPA
jgi:ABC-2 type transport system permease protein